MAASESTFAPLSLSFTSCEPRPRTASRPSLPGRLNLRSSVSLTNFISSQPSEETPPSSPDPQPLEDRHADCNYRPRKRRAKSRIARPKDAMPGFRRRRHFGSSNKRSNFRFQSKSAPGAASHFDRGLTSASYYNRPELSTGPDQQQVELPPAPLCLVHAKPTVLLTCRKQGRNHARQFFKCSLRFRAQCDFFRWADQSGAPISDDENPLSSTRVAVEAPPVHMLNDCDDQQLYEILENFFGYQEFRPAQQEALSKLFSSHSAVALMPTGGGKSFIYQMYAVTHPGMVVVVTPLLSLMDDQIANLPECLPGVSLRSSQPAEAISEAEDRIYNGTVKVLFISPERLFSSRFRRLMGAKNGPSISLLVIDEAHCISQWSHNFRTSYLRIPIALFGSPGEAPVFKRQPLVLALTATATRETIADICSTLKIDSEANVVKCDLTRKNLRLSLSKVSGSIDAKGYALVKRLKMEPFSNILGIASEAATTNQETREGSFVSKDKDGVLKRKRGRVASASDDMRIGWGSNVNVTKRIRAQKRRRSCKHSGALLIYVTKQKDCETLKNYLISASLYLRGKISMYHAGMHQKERRKVQSDFGNGSVAIVVATIAFGMGLNYSNIRGVIHFDQPSSLEAYWQEVGRAGRGGEESYCEVFFCAMDACRALSRCHSDGIDKSTVRQFLQRLLSSKFELNTVTERTRTFLQDHSSADGNDSENQIESDEYNTEIITKDADIGRDTRFTMCLTEYDLNRSLDMKFETAETICSLLEKSMDSFCLLKPSNTIVKVGFYSQTPETLLKSHSKTLRVEDRMLLDTIVKHGKNNGGQYSVDLVQASLREDQIIGSLKRLQGGRHITFELLEKGLQIECTSECVQKLGAEINARAQDVHNKLCDIERIRKEKASTVVTVFSRADKMLTNCEQSEFLHRAIRNYFTGEKPELKEETENGLVEVKEVHCREEKARKIRNASLSLMKGDGCSSRVPQNGRQIARILHGINSAAFRAKDWYAHRCWGQFVEVDFEETMRIVRDVVREQHGRKDDSMKVDENED